MGNPEHDSDLRPPLLDFVDRNDSVARPKYGYKLEGRTAERENRVKAIMPTGKPVCNSATEGSLHHTQKGQATNMLSRQLEGHADLFRPARADNSRADPPEFWFLANEILLTVWLQSLQDSRTQNKP